MRYNEENENGDDKYVVKCIICKDEVRTDEIKVSKFPLPLVGGEVRCLTCHESMTVEKFHSHTHSEINECSMCKQLIRPGYNKNHEEICKSLHTCPVCSCYAENMPIHIASHELYKRVSLCPYNGRLWSGCIGMPISIHVRECSIDRDGDVSFKLSCETSAGIIVGYDFDDNGREMLEVKTLHEKTHSSPTEIDIFLNNTNDIYLLEELFKETHEDEQVYTEAEKKLALGFLKEEQEMKTVCSVGGLTSYCDVH
jgi:hypothetical protein